MTLLTRTFLGLIGLLGVAASPGWAQVTLTQPEYSITFGAGWTMADTVYVLVAKDSGIGGLALLRSSRDDGKALNADEQAKALGDSLEATLTPGPIGSRKIGSYTVQTIDFKYDELRRVEREAKERAGKDVSFKNGTFRAYYIRSHGVLVTIMGVSTLAFLTPYAGIEAAIATLAFTPAGILSNSARNPSMSWTLAGGRLRFTGAQPSANAAFDVRGRNLGSWRVSKRTGNRRVPQPKESR